MAFEGPRASFEAARVPAFARAARVPSHPVADAGLVAIEPVPEIELPAGGFDLPAGSSGATGLRSDRIRPIQKAGNAAPSATADVPPRPGSFGTAPISVPSEFLKTKLIAPHTAPDIELGVNDRTSLGLFSEVGRTSREDVRSSTTREGRDLGAGVTLQYKFGSP